jgi:hypothetical protein
MSSVKWWAEYEAGIRQTKNIHKILIEEPEEKRDYLRNRDVEWKTILKWILKKRCEIVNWIQMAQDRVQWRDHVKTVMNLRALWKAGNCLEIWPTITSSNRALIHGDGLTQTDSAPKIKKWLAAAIVTTHLIRLDKSHAWMECTHFNATSKECDCSS